MARTVTADLWVLPELFATGYQFAGKDEVRALAEEIAGPTVTTMGDKAAEIGCWFCGGFPEAERGTVYNSAFLVGPEGQRHVYRKVHLFDREKELFAPGDKGFYTVDIGGVSVGMMVCFDWIFPEAARTLALKGAQIIAHPSNLVLPWCPEAMITRSLENRVFTMTANRIGRELRTDTPLEFIGLSQVVSPLGKRLAQLGSGETGAAIATINITETDKMITAANDLFADRRPEFYQI